MAAVGTTEIKEARTLGVGRVVSSSVAVLSPGERPRGSGDAAPWFSNIARKLRTPEDMAAVRKRRSVSECVVWGVVERNGGCGS